MMTASILSGIFAILGLIVGSGIVLLVQWFNDRKNDPRRIKPKALDMNLRNHAWTEAEIAAWNADQIKAARGYTYPTSPTGRIYHRAYMYPSASFTPPERESTYPHPDYEYRYEQKTEPDAADKEWQETHED